MEPDDFLREEGLRLVKLNRVKPRIPYYPTPREVIDRIIELASPKPGESLVDLGCGDARILTRAAQLYDDIKCYGVEINPVLATASARKIERLGLSGRVKIYNDDLFNTDLSKYNIITLYLTPEALKLLSEKIIVNTARGTRIISHDYPIPGLHPETCEKLNIDGKKHRLYLYVI